MAWKRSVLVVANVTATSKELHEALAERAKREPLRVTLVVPATPFGGDADIAQERLSEALQMLAEAGIEADGVVGNSDPVVAVNEAWNPRRHDEVLISTLPAGVSRWLEGGLPARISKLTDAQVSQIISQPERHASMAPVPPEPTHLGVLTPFAALGGGRG
jgi:hypothetical protein